jgi:two-component system OmpR family sensor kinase
MTAAHDSSPVMSAPRSSPSANASSRTLQELPKESLIRRRVPFLFSVRFGITSWYAGVLILTIAFLGIGFRMLLVRSLEQDSRERLMDSAETVLQQMTEVTFIVPEGDMSNAYEISRSEGFDAGPVQLSGVSVTLIEMNTRKEVFSMGTYSGFFPGTEDVNKYLRLREPDYEVLNIRGHNVRSLIYPIESNSLRNPADGSPLLIGLLFATESIATTNRILTQLNQVLLVSGIVGAGIASIGGWILAGRALVPVSRIMSSAEDIANDRSAASLSRRLVVPRTGDEIAQLAETFNDMLDRIEQAFTAQRRFVADASHELRTPLTSIKGNIDVLRLQIAAGRSLDPEDISDALADVARESARMSRLVEDLLSLARTEAEVANNSGDKRLTSLDVLAEEAIRTADVLVHGQHLQLEAHEPVILNANGDQLVQVMLILLDNALRHTPAGGWVTLRIRREIDPVDHISCACIEVSDTGQGIDSEHLPHLFERFYRAENARDRRSGGTGLGLAIALSIVRAHKGWIDVASVPSQGTTFTVWLPLKERDINAQAALPSRRTGRGSRRKAKA